MVSPFISAIFQRPAAHLRRDALADLLVGECIARGAHALDLILFDIAHQGQATGQRRRVLQTGLEAVDDRPLSPPEYSSVFLRFGLWFLKFLEGAAVTIDTSYDAALSMDDSLLSLAHESSGESQEEAPDQQPDILLPSALNDTELASKRGQRGVGPGAKQNGRQWAIFCGKGHDGDLLQMLQSLKITIRGPFQLDETLKRSRMLHPHNAVEPKPEALRRPSHRTLISGGEDRSHKSRFGRAPSMVSSVGEESAWPVVRASGGWPRLWLRKRAHSGERLLTIREG